MAQSLPTQMSIPMPALNLADLELPGSPIDPRVRETPRLVYGRFLYHAWVRSPQDDPAALTFDVRILEGRYEFQDWMTKAEVNYVANLNAKLAMKLVGQASGESVPEHISS